MIAISRFHSYFNQFTNLASNFSNRLPYTHATILEIQRLSYTAPASLLHYATEDIEVKSGSQSYTIPRGANVICNLRKFLLDPDIFKEPKQFRPERFLDSDGSIVKYDQVRHFGSFKYRTSQII